MYTKISLGSDVVGALEARLVNVVSSDVKKINKAILRSFPALASEMNRNIAKEVQEDYYVKRVRTIKRTLSGRSTGQGYKWTSRGGQLPISAFRTRKLKKGYKLLRAKGSPARVERQSWWNPRKGAIYKRAGRERYPIEPFFGPSVPQMIQNRGALDRVIVTSESAFYRKLDAELTKIGY